MLSLFPFVPVPMTPVVCRHVYVRLTIMSRSEFALRKDRIMKALTRVAGLVAVVMVLPISEARASLLSEWNFDETTGSVAHDSVGTVDGTLHGNAAFVTGGV